MEGRKSPLGTADVARESRYSVQQIRNLERDGVLPAVRRGPTGYRIYSDVHVHAARAYRELAAGVGPVEAKVVMRALYTLPKKDLLELLDAAHARLHAERQDLARAQQAVAAIAAETIDDSRSSDAMSISELADALGIRPSTLRHWDAEGLVVPRRTSTAEARTYAPSDVRDARIVHQLRLAGYGIESLRALLQDLRSTRRWTDVGEALAARDVSITNRSYALLRAAAALAPLLDYVET